MHCKFPIIRYSSAGSIFAAHSDPVFLFEGLVIEPISSGEVKRSGNGGGRRTLIPFSMKTETFEKAFVSTGAQFNMNGSVQGLALTKRLGIGSF